MQPDNEKAVYGFAAWLTASALLFIFFTWALGFITPDFYFPHVYWSVGGPAVLAVTLICYLLRVPLIGLASTQDIDDWRTVTDHHAKVIQETECLPAIGDIPIHEVTRRLYG
eukprot:TRINITY_DN19960_c3_g1_i1.p1 TRINITY_DN19960_c3_g1~~TRINITY_DN19960_c3_g1_i1.p1  ORF type:complete len:112 (+),score=18.42 TRINITY_DN19960_c3_g1_i1:61-396(+)